MKIIHYFSKLFTSLLSHLVMEFVAQVHRFAAQTFLEGGRFIAGDIGVEPNYVDLGDL